MHPAGTFEVLCADEGSSARVGRLWTAHGAVMTPVFMPVGTQASVKGMSPAELAGLGVEMLVGNTYHMMVRPGVDVVGAAGGLHRFMGWNRPILTDSGGFQVHSLARLRRVTDEGVFFNSHVDGAALMLSPAEAMRIQTVLASDIAMALDECPSHPCTRDCACQAVDRTVAWAVCCSQQPRAAGQMLFGIVQGSQYEDLRERCATELRALRLDGYAVGGVSVGEPESQMMAVMRRTVAHLPAERPRYLMGVGLVHQIVEAVAHGFDMFDCVVPTRYARNGGAFTRSGVYPVKAGEYKNDSRPIEEGCSCYACANFSRAYVRHLLNVGEILGVRLVTIHNLHRYMEAMREIRNAIRDGTFGLLRAECERTRAAAERPVDYAVNGGLADAVV